MLSPESKALGYVCPCNWEMSRCVECCRFYTIQQREGTYKSARVLKVPPGRVQPSLKIGGEMESPKMSVSRSATGHVVLSIGSPGANIEQLYTWSWLNTEDQEKLRKFLT